MTWLSLSSIAIGAAVRLIKSDRLDAVLARYNIPMVPRRALPWISLVLGIGAGVVAALTRHLGWSEALQEGLVSGALSIAGHELFVESIRDGKEVGASPTPPMPDLTVVPKDEAH